MLAEFENFNQSSQAQAQSQREIQYQKTNMAHAVYADLITEVSDSREFALPSVELGAR